jgi:hypothetical protein
MRTAEARGCGYESGTKKKVKLIEHAGRTGAQWRESLRRFPPSAPRRRKLRYALWVELIDENGGGPGVRLRKRHQKRVKRLGIAGLCASIANLRPNRTAHKTLGGRTLERPLCGGFMPTAETILIPAHRPKISLTSNARLDNEPNLIAGGFSANTQLRQQLQQVCAPNFRVQ